MLFAQHRVLRTGSSSSVKHDASHAEVHPIFGRAPEPHLHRTAFGAVQVWWDCCPYGQRARSYAFFVARGWFRQSGVTSSRPPVPRRGITRAVGRRMPKQRWSQLFYSPDGIMIEGQIA